MRVWVTLFVGFTNTLISDQESGLDSELFSDNSAEVVMKLQFSGVESHNSIGVGGKYHDPLRRVFKNFIDDVPLMEKETALRLTLKWCNDKHGPNGLVPTLLVFGTMPTLPIPNSKSLRQKERMAALKTSKDEMERISVEQNILRALRSNLHPAAIYNIQPGDLVRVFREENRKWIGPVKVVKTERNIIYVLDDVKTKAFNASQVIPISINNVAQVETLDMI